ncbi:Uncharacterised protein [Blautia hydrogenotrophica]|uniref:Uncharacterized protein n=1 Tax=Blautia hydrogenotrophica (strain DSM 10507 / JCM 14656 / S5a33) TaxID=476272 RepID=C0CP21_BLAHS|nr:hypothetical protein RUMHYD_02622 [Blautia hydrogenotrophica DSM 10507]CUN11154.1 Uncharacterised protein [Blautia hydrogenotrophica]SCH70156.1 Uncharacterised protein [uncultured Blautia sp.]
MQQGVRGRCTIFGDRFENTWLMYFRNGFRQLCNALFLSRGTVSAAFSVT